MSKLLTVQEIMDRVFAPVTSEPRDQSVERAAEREYDRRRAAYAAEADRVRNMNHA